MRNKNTSCYLIWYMPFGFTKSIIKVLLKSLNTLYMYMNYSLNESVELFTSYHNSYRLMLSCHWGWLIPRMITRLVSWLSWISRLSRICLVALLIRVGHRCPRVTSLRWVCCFSLWCSSHWSLSNWGWWLLPSISLTRRWVLGLRSLIPRTRVGWRCIRWRLGIFM